LKARFNMKQTTFGILLGALLAGIGQAASVHLTIWSYLTPPEVNVVQEYANRWAQAHGATVSVELQPGSNFNEFLTAAPTGKGPDIIFGLPHNNVGPFYAAGLVEPLPAGFIDPSDYSKDALNACSFNGTLYSVPLAEETYALFYNKKLVPTPPKTWDQLVAIAKALDQKYGAYHGFMYDITNFYYTYAIIHGMGGYVFKIGPHGYEANQIGLGNAGAIRAYTFIQDLVTKDHLMPSDVNYNIAMARFDAGQLGMTITGPWGISSVQQAHIDFGIAPLPSPSAPFSGYQVAFVSRFSHNQQMAFSLLHYLVVHTPLALLKAGHRIPAEIGFQKTLQVTQNPLVEPFVKQFATAQAMPNIPAMNAVWTPEGNILSELIQGKVTPEQAAQIVVKQIEVGIATQH
jgi:arabinogalactan oligomer/maltooligosaccharide transport system substrate-binding protein